MNDNVVTINGNATRDPELRFTPTGLAVCQFGLAVNRRWKNRQTDEFEEKVSFFDVTCWQQLAENVAESILKGSRIIVVGRLDQDTWEDKETKEKRNKVKIVADYVGVDLRWATAEITKNERRDSTSNQRPDFPHGDAGGGHDLDEEPFLVDAASWWPEVGLGMAPHRMLP